MREEDEVHPPRSSLPNSRLLSALLPAVFLKRRPNMQKGRIDQGLPGHFSAAETRALGSLIWEAGWLKMVLSAHQQGNQHAACWAEGGAGRC